MKILNPIIFFVLSLILFSLIIKKLWSYLVIRLFPEAVNQNFIVKEISWQISLILSLIFIMLVQNS